MVDLKVQYLKLKREIDQAVSSVLDSGRFILGPQGEVFEEEIADFLGAKHTIGVASGTDALHLALVAAGIGPGDEVITTPFTFIATAEAIAYVGATPVFADIDSRTFNIDPQCVKRAITGQTRAVLPVHLFGQPAEITALRRLCEEHNLLLVEDCAQSCGAAYGKGMTGTWGDLGCFSFFPSKNLGCYGDGGLVCTNRDDLAATLRMLRHHGSSLPYHHSMLGYNSRLDEIQAAVLRVKLKYLDEFNRRRRENAHYYSLGLKDLDVAVPSENPSGIHIYNIYTILTADRQRLQEALTEAGIASAIYYPIPVHHQDFFRQFATGKSFPVSEQVSKQVLSLPLYPELTFEQIDRVVEVVGGALN
ncbi:MAG: DegT/DnrJ/EryC1/StrS family aminotransferase [Deltaproteobacteria bacterium]|nr:DegT/DnrJ/EryC1/StrS family aminotransferase [Deltaproteobacteria bacterium]